VLVFATIDLCATHLLNEFTYSAMHRHVKYIILLYISYLSIYLSDTDSSKSGQGRYLGFICKVAQNQRRSDNVL
jgi:hypothetical protein